MSAAVALIEQEGQAIVQKATMREPAKVVALRVGATPRQVYNWREGECQPRWPQFIALALEYPELRAAVARWLNLTDKNAPDAAAALDAIRRLVERMPEEGDRA
jgi:hypothetical protein